MNVLQLKKAKRHVLRLEDKVYVFAVSGGLVAITGTNAKWGNDFFRQQRTKEHARELYRELLNQGYKVI